MYIMGFSGDLDIERMEAQYNEVFILSQRI